MTLVAAFVRRLPERSRRREELVVASDSRLTGGQHFDQGAKIFSLARSDALFAFAGDTYYAYPLSFQLATAIGMRRRSVDRRLPLAKAVAHACDTVAQSYGLIHSFPVGSNEPIEGDASFIVAGYSWHDARYLMWKISLHRQTKRFVRTRVKGRHCFIGTPAAIKSAQRRLGMLLHSRGRNAKEMDMEPFEVLRDIIQEEEFSDVGGAPQIAKVFAHMNAQFFTTLWPSGSDGQVRQHIYGRPMMDMEVTDWPCFDPQGLVFKGPLPKAAQNRIPR